jgi:phospholipid/cholesterol/gamma-HCH transport system substrate-binding protein
MAQRRTLAWTELRVGLLVIISFALLAAAIFFVGGETGIFTEKMTITAQLPSGDGLRPGAEVWLDGVVVGNVSRVSIAREPRPGYGVDVEMRIDAQYQNLIRTDSTLSIGNIGLLGDKNVEISRGTEAGQPVADGGIIQGKAAGDIRRIISGTDDLVANLKVLSDKFVEISDTIDRGEGTLGKILNNSEIHDNMNNAVLEAEMLIKDIRTGPGTTGRLINDDEIYERMSGLLNRIDSLVVRAESGNGTIARFLNDPALYESMDRLLVRMDDLTARLDRGEGTFGKLLRDEGLYNDMRGTMDRLNGLVAAIQEGNGTAGLLIKDPTLFNTMNQTISEVQKLLYDLRQDPRKYLTVQFRLF